MNPFARILRLLPKLVPLGVVTVAIVLGWGRFYAIVGECVCRVSAALGSSSCSPGAIPDAAALLARLENVQRITETAGASGASASGGGPAK